MKTQLELAKLTNSRAEQALVCGAMGYSEMKEYGVEQWDWLVNNLVYSYKALVEGEYKVFLIKVEDKKGDFVYGTLVQEMEGEKMSLPLNTLDSYSLTEKNFEDTIQKTHNERYRITFSSTSNKDYAKIVIKKYLGDSIVVSEDNFSLIVNGNIMSLHIKDLFNYSSIFKMSV